jgi:hypothetical protein
MDAGHIFTFLLVGVATGSARDFADQFAPTIAKLDQIRVFEGCRDTAVRFCDWNEHFNDRGNAVRLDALQRQKVHTYLQGEHVFHDPKTGEPWKYQTITDVRSFWKMTLKRLGIRYRRPYNMRHTYATLGVMSGARPAFLATQLGHSLRVFFEVYAKWINSKDDREEIAKLDQAIAQLSPNCPQPVDTGPEDRSES